MASDSVDVILCTSTDPARLDLDSALGEAARVCRAGARIVVGGVGDSSGHVASLLAAHGFSLAHLSAPSSGTQLWHIAARRG